MKQPAELMSMFVIPAIRNKIVKELKSNGLRQEYIAGLLDVTPSAVSQYVKDKRGSEIVFCDMFLKKLKNDVDKLYKSFGDDMDVNQRDVFKVINELSLFFKREKMLCSMCQEENRIDKCNINCK